MSKLEDSKTLASIIAQQTGKIVLNTEEAAKILGISKRSLEDDRAEAIGIPFTRLNNKPKGKPLYSVIAIAKQIIENEAKTI
jgi:hypothetical protein